MTMNNYIRRFATQWLAVTVIVYTCIALAFVTHSPTTQVVSVGEGIEGGIVVAAVRMSTAVTDLAGIGIAGLPVLPWFIVVERQAAITRVPISIMHTHTYRIDAVATLT